MKKVSLFFFAFFLAVNFSFAQDKTLVKTIDAEESTSIEFGFSHKEIRLDEWDDDGRIRIELEIHSNMSESIMEQLVKAGRYTLEPSVENGALVIKAPNTEKAVNVKGTDLDEEIYVNVKAHHIFMLASNDDGQFLQKDLGVAMADAGGRGVEISETQKQNFLKIRDKVEIGSIKFVQKDGTNPELKIGSGVQTRDIIMGGKPVGFE